MRPAVYGRAEARPVTGKVAAVYNPRSGKRRGQRAAEELRDLLAGMDGPPVELHATQYAFHAAELVRGLELGPGDLVVAVGGDGTLSEVITGLMERAGDGPRVPVAVLPAGTGNCMAVDLGFRTVRQVAEAIVRGTFTDVDLCEASYVKGLPGSEQAAKGERATTYICNMMGYGLGVDANIAAEKLRWLGPLRYDVGIVQEIIKAKQRKTRFTADGTAFALDVSMALLLNNQCTGKNLPLAPFSQLDDGKIDFLLLENKSRLETLKLFNACKAQGRHVFAKSGVHYLRVKESLTIETDAPEAINIDGENVGSTPFSMKFLPGAIPLLLPGPAAAPAGGGDRL